MSGAAPDDRWVVVDASVWISRYVPVDPNHHASRAWLYRHLSTGRRIVAPTLLLVEITGAIARRMGDASVSEQISLQLRQLPGLYWVGLSGDLAAWAAELAIRFRLRGADAVYVALADRLTIPLITLDNEQLTRPQPPVIVRTPAAPPLP